MLSRRLLRIKALKAIYAHLQSGGDNLLKTQKRMLQSVDKSYDLYFLLLQLPVEMAEYARQQQELAKQKHLATYEDKNPNTKFVDSPLVHLLETSDLLGDYLIVNKLSWRAQQDFVKEIFKQLVEHPKYKAYMDRRDERTIKEDLALMECFYVEVLQENENFEDVVSEFSIDMLGDLPHVLPLVMRTVSSIKPSHTELKIVPKYKNDDDEQFVRSLFERSLINLSNYKEYLEQFTSNWDLERVVMMDELILVVAMAEMLNFPSIPTKVTMNEFIEISKYYSTSSSSVFVNGILDRATASLVEEGKITKVGRGLL